MTITRAELLAQLQAPFPPSAHEVLPIGKPFTDSKGAEKVALAIFADARMYQARLDEVLGPDNWSVEYRVLDQLVICRLTVTVMDKTVVREDVGEIDIDSDNAYTTAVAQSYKRACTALGVGRYLYTLPRYYARWDSQHRRPHPDDVAAVLNRVAQDVAQLQAASAPDTSQRDDIETAIQRLMPLVKHARSVGIEVPPLTPRGLREQGLDAILEFERSLSDQIRLIERGGE